jgi:hypothetical protein
LSIPSHLFSKVTFQLARDRLKDAISSGVRAIRSLSIIGVTLWLAVRRIMSRTPADLAVKE